MPVIRGKSGAAGAAPLNGERGQQRCPINGAAAGLALAVLIGINVVRGFNVVRTHHPA